jgi:hypothetical protein
LSQPLTGGALNLVKQDKNGEVLTNIQVGITSWVFKKCYHRGFPNAFTRVSEVADWVKETVCARKGELCKQSKAGKMSKMVKKYPDTCVPVSTYAPSTPWPTWSPTVTPQPWTPWPTDGPTITAQPSTPMPTDEPTLTRQPSTPIPTYFPSAMWEWPTWMPTKGKSGKE